MSALAADRHYMPDPHDNKTDRPLSKSESRQKLIQQLYETWQELERAAIQAKEDARLAEELYRKAAELPVGFPNISGMPPVKATVAILNYRGTWMKKSEVVSIMDQRWQGRRGATGNLDRALTQSDRVVIKPNPDDKNDPFIGLPEWKK